jgi:hypothetical protein
MSFMQTGQTNWHELHQSSKNVSTLQLNAMNKPTVDYEFNFSMNVDCETATKALLLSHMTCPT